MPIGRGMKYLWTVSLSMTLTQINGNAVTSWAGTTSRTDFERRYTVSATGQVPSRGVPNCYAVSRSPDSSSFQITIYGGWSQFEGRAYEDVYVLTVPSFRWIKISSQNNVESQAGKTVGRVGSTCATWQDAQMIVLGGTVLEGPKVMDNNTFCNATYTPIRVLDTSTYTWQSEFKPDASYKVHGNISSVIGGEYVS